MAESIRSDLPKPTICAVIITCDEAHLLEPCLLSVAGWVDSILVVDMHSADGSASLAESYGARVLEHERLPYADPARNFAIAHAEADWILVLDPDERARPQLGPELRRLAEAGTYDAVEIPFVQRAFGADLTSAGGQDSGHVRFFRRGAVTWPAEVHGVPDLRGLRVHRIGRNDGFRAGHGIDHDTWRSPHEVLAKLARYTADDAAARQRRGARFSFTRMVLAVTAEFARRFLVGRSYRDGMPGLLHSAYFAIYRFSIEAELWELDGRPKEADRTVKRLGHVVGAPFVWIKPVRDTIRRLRRR